ncbi:MAG TPA: transporter substrate-binding domain-containing protein, partial [Paraburkholderia sp.]
MMLHPGRLGRRWLAALSLALAVAFAPATAQVSPAADTADTSRTVAGQSVVRTFAPTLRVGVLADGWPPFDVLDGDRLSGFSVAYLRLLVGPDVELVPRRFADMSQLLAAACAGEVDLVMSVARTPERERCLAFTTPYLRGTVAFVTRSGDTGALASGAPADRSRIATEKGFALESSLHRRFP